jgi:hypothetical protein
MSVMGPETKSKVEMGPETKSKVEMGPETKSKVELLIAGEPPAAAVADVTAAGREDAAVVEEAPPSGPICGSTGKCAKEEAEEMVAVGNAAKRMADTFATAMNGSSNERKQHEGVPFLEGVPSPSNEDGRGIPATTCTALSVLPGWSSVADAMAWAQRPSNISGVVLVGAAACVLGGAVLLSLRPRGGLAARGHMFRKI